MSVLTIASSVVRSISYALDLHISLAASGRGLDNTYSKMRLRNAEILRTTHSQRLRYIRQGPQITYPLPPVPAESMPAPSVARCQWHDDDDITLRPEGGDM